MINVEAGRLREPAAWLMVAVASTGVLIGVEQLLFGDSSSASFAFRAATHVSGLTSPVTAALLVGAVLLAGRAGPAIGRLKLMVQTAVGTLGLAALFGTVGLFGGLFAGETSIWQKIEFLVVNLPALALTGIALAYLLPRMAAAGSAAGGSRVKGGFAPPAEQRFQDEQRFQEQRPHEQQYAGPQGHPQQGGPVGPQTGAHGPQSGQLPPQGLPGQDPASPQSFPVQEAAQQGSHAQEQARQHGFPQQDPASPQGLHPQEQTFPQGSRAQEQVQQHGFAQGDSAQYGLPQHEPATQYGLPPQDPATQYGYPQQPTPQPVPVQLPYSPPALPPAPSSSGSTGGSEGYGSDGYGQTSPSNDSYSHTSQPSYAQPGDGQSYGAQSSSYGRPQAQPGSPASSESYTTGSYGSADVQPAAQAQPYEQQAAAYDPLGTAYDPPAYVSVEQSPSSAYTDPQLPNYPSPTESPTSQTSQVSPASPASGYVRQADQPTSFYGSQPEMSPYGSSDGQPRPPFEGQHSFPPAPRSEQQASQVSQDSFYGSSSETHRSQPEASPYGSSDSQPRLSFEGQHSFPQPPENYGQPFTGYSGAEYARQTEPNLHYPAPDPVDPRSQQMAQAYQQAENYQQQSQAGEPQPRGSEYPDYTSSQAGGSYDDRFGHPQGHQASQSQPQGAQQYQQQWEAAPAETTLRFDPNAYQGDALSGPTPAGRSWDSQPIDPTAIYKPERSSQVTGEETPDRERVGPGQDQNMSWYGSDRREH
ncbi:hypothetical protein [Streptosporangium sp. NPDC051022]|uniref:hypothetical protein n=1 Tax=Streptosporangium sp. NPDC051022 TaxID=3155752 RepID=UPI00342F6B0B